MFRGRIPAAGEPLWLDDDREWAMAWLIDDRSKLSCGCYPDETVGPEHADRWTVEPMICERHRQIGETATAWFRDAGPADAKHGLLWTATRDED